MSLTTVCLLALSPAHAATTAAEPVPTGISSARLWKAGVARSKVTPTNSLWMAGYAGRTRSAEGKASDLWLKALALEDATGHRAVILTCDVLAIRNRLYRKCVPRLKTECGLDPEQVLLAASHTHCGPMLPNRPGSLSALDARQQALIEEYEEHLANTIIETARQALAHLAPAQLTAGQTKAEFAANRRNNPERQRASQLDQGTLAGPVEHSVPVLAITAPEGKLRAVLFGYACHNTTLTRDFYQWCGDYAGFAQAALERSHPEATAMFFIGCAGDQDPVVRGKLELAEYYGNQLAIAVEQALRETAAPLPAVLKTRMETISLNLGPCPTEAELERWRSDPTPYVRRWATNLLADLKSDRPLERTYPYPVQVWQLGGEQLLVALGGEPVVDYAINFKHEFGAQTWIAGYANDVMCYIPSLRVLDEDKPPVRSPLWGYEGSQAMKVLGLPALRWADDVEDLITASVRRLVRQTTER